MKILISSLQVSQDGASKGHLHPAIELGLELKKRHHEVSLLPLPSPFNYKDVEQITRCQLGIIEPPPLPLGLLLSQKKLGQLAKTSLTTAKAYHSFLVAPLDNQFEKIIEKIKEFNPDIVVYDLLVYAAPLAARLLGIPEIGFCAGLKLIAPSHLTGIYQSIYQELEPIIHFFLKKYSLTAEFHHLELLSNTHQFVFTSEKFIDGIKKIIPRKTILTGSLPISVSRCEENKFFLNESDKKFIVICFGSVLDPSYYLDMIQLIIETSKKWNHDLIISTKNPHPVMKDKKITVAPYLPLPQLLKKASLFIHHGGANTFSESLTIGVPQILIPLTTDQPIQAEFLKNAKAGIAIYPHEVTKEKLSLAFQQLLDKTDPIHEHIKIAQKIFQESQGAIIAANIIEKSINISNKKRK